MKPDCSRLPGLMHDLVHKIASEDPTVRNFDDVAARMEKIFPGEPRLREAISEDFNAVRKLKAEQRAAKAAERAGQAVNVAKQVMKEGNKESKLHERAQKLIEMDRTLKKSPKKPVIQKRYENARIEFLSEFIKSQTPITNAKIKTADLEADLARFKDKKASKREIDSLVEKYAPKPQKPVSKELEAARNEAAKARDQVEHEIAKRKETLHKKAWRLVNEPFNLIRNVKLSLDFGHFSRQGEFASKAHPIIWAKAVINSFKALDYNFRGAFGSQENFRTFQRNHIQNNTWHDKAVKSGLRVNASSQNEFDAGIGEKLANIVPGISWSNISYGAFINKLRMDYFAYLADKMKNPTAADLKSLASQVNTYTGYSTVGGQGGNQLLGVYMLSPADTIAKLKRVTFEPIIGPGHTMATRKLAAMEYLRYARGWLGMRALRAIGKGLGLYGANAVGGDDEEDSNMEKASKFAGKWFGMELDPRSPYFGQDKVMLDDGTMQYTDTNGGLFAPIVVAYQIWSGERKDPETGDIVDISDNRLRPLWKWLRYRANPMADTLLTVGEGKDAIGREVGPETIPEFMGPINAKYKQLDDAERAFQMGKHILWNSVPLMAQDIREEMGRQGMEGGEMRMINNLLGRQTRVIDY